MIDLRGAFASPHLVDAVLAFTLAEALWLTRPRHRRVGAVLLTLLPGVCLMLALRAALAGATWPWLPLALAASFVAHVADLRMRFRR